MHNWWHLALFQLELGDPAAALAIYDREVHHEGSEATALNLVDASAMLWRLYLDRVDAGPRFGALADSWAGRRRPPVVRLQRRARHHGLRRRRAAGRCRSASSSG